MNKIYFLTIFLSLTIVSSFCNAFDTKAEYAILVDADTGEVLFEKNSDIAMPPSSMSKLMTIYTVFDALNRGTLTMDEVFTISENAWLKGGSKMFIQVNDRVSVENLLRGIIVQSGNDACIAVAEGMSGTEESFVELMNQKIKELGLNNTNLKNSTGWPDQEHLMSSRDLSILAIRLIKDFPKYYHLFGEKDFTFNNIKQDNRNMLLNRNIGVDGLKTGHTEIAGYGITASAKRNDRRLILVVNGLKSTIERAAEAEKLIQYGFLNFNNINLFKKGEVIEIANVWLGKTKTVPLTIGEDIIITLAKHSQKDIKVEIIYDNPIKAPIEKDQIVGKIQVYLPNKPQLIFDLIAAEEVKDSEGLDRFMKNFNYFIFKKG